MLLTGSSNQSRQPDSTTSAYASIARKASERRSRAARGPAPRCPARRAPRRRAPPTSLRLERLRDRAARARSPPRRAPARGSRRTAGSPRPGRSGRCRSRSGTGAARSARAARAAARGRRGCRSSRRVVNVESISISSLKTSPSGVSTSAGNLVRAISYFLAASTTCVDRALQEEGALGHLVVLAVDDLVEAADRLGDRHVRAGGAGELLGDEERLREEALDLARALDGELVLVGELVDAEDRDDVLQLLVALQDLLDAVGDAEVLLAEDVRP